MTSQSRGVSEGHSSTKRWVPSRLAHTWFPHRGVRPQMADQALACLEMMDFDRKNGIMERIARNGTLFQRMVMMQQQMIQMATIIDRTQGTNMAEQIASGIIGAPVPAASGSGKAAENAKQTEALGGDSGTKESSTTKNARQRVAESTSPK